MTEKKRRGGGGKLARTENVQVRLDPRLRFAAELAAGKERRTLSSFIEWVVDRAVKEVTVTRDKDGKSITAAAVVDKVWDIDDDVRFVELATHFPELLTYEEQSQWKKRSQMLDETLTKLADLFGFETRSIEDNSEVFVDIKGLTLKEFRDKLEEYIEKAKESDNGSPD
ncbi:MAG: hypothetical protein PHE55_18170 [Methylococcaceae bacterium]|nr:hypothetical protein [Methylococcaceae bacterium]